MVKDHPMRPIPLISALAVTLLLAACDNATPPAPAASASAATAEAPAGVTIADGRLNLPGVAGNPGAVYFTLTNGGSEPLVLSGASVERAGMAMLHQTVEQNGVMEMSATGELTVAPGEAVTFAPGGHHVMAMDLDPALAVGDTVSVTLSFASGATASFPARVLAAGDPG